MDEKYLLCYVVVGGSGEDALSNTFPKWEVQSEEFDTFREAIERYTFLCETSRSVTLSKISDNGRGQIIRQFKAGNNNIYIC